MFRAASASELSAVLGVSERRVRQRANKEAWAFEEKLRGEKAFLVESLPADVLLRIGAHYGAAAVAPAAANAATQQRKPATEKAAPDPEKIEALRRAFATAPEGAQDAAHARVVGLVAWYRAKRSGGDAGQCRRALRAAHPKLCKASADSVLRWRRDIEGVPAEHWPLFLLPAYSQRGRRSTDIDKGLLEFIKSDYLRAEAPTLSSCIERAKDAAAANGWEVPSYAVIHARIQAIPRQVRALAREGADALKDMYPAQTRDVSGLAAMDICNIDGHRFDVFVRFEDGTIARPMMVAIQDVYSRMLVAHRIGQTESSDLTQLAVRDMVANYGIWDAIVLDNGRAFASKRISGGAKTRFRFKVKDTDPQGLLKQLGMEIHWALPFSGQSKPIERAFKDLCDRISRSPACAGAYTGNHIDAKPENYGDRAIDIEQFRAIVASGINAHNARTGRRVPHLSHDSFAAAFAASYANRVVRRASPRQLANLLLVSEAVTASRKDGSIRLGGNRYWTEALCAHAGQQVVARFDPANLHSQIAVHTLADDAHICDAPCIAAVGFADTNAAREHARARKQWNKAARVQLQAERTMSAAELAAQLPTTDASPMPAPAATQLLQPAKRAAAPAVQGLDPDIDDPRQERWANWLQGQVTELKKQHIG